MSHDAGASKGQKWLPRSEYRRRQRKKMVRCAGCGSLEFPGIRCLRCDTVTDENGHEVEGPEG